MSPGANDDGSGDRRNHDDYLGTTDAAEEQLPLGVGRNPQLFANLKSFRTLSWAF